jgi:hypothetical protein
LPRNSRDNGILQNARQRYYFLFSSLAQMREKSTKRAIKSKYYLKYKNCNTKSGATGSKAAKI